MENTDVLDGNCFVRQQRDDINNSGNDSEDLTPNNGSDTSPEKTALMYSNKHDLYYYMNSNHHRRGVVYIFDHQKFSINCSERHGTDVDFRKLRQCFINLSFDVHSFKDLKLSEIKEQISMAASMDHTDHDCFILIVLSHGDHGVLCAKDMPYNPHEVIFSQFSADKCPSLAGKPKIFFIQACQGKQLDTGIILVDRMRRTETDGLRRPYRIPVLADFLIMYASSKGYYAMRNNHHGSYFINALCEELESKACEYNLLTILTIVIQRVAVDFVSVNYDKKEYHDKKQSPYFESSLTRLVFFPVLN